MTDNPSTKVNSELPDEDALGAFAAGAFGGSRRGRRNKQPAAVAAATDSTATGSNPDSAVEPVAAAEEPAQPTAEATGEKIPLPAPATETRPPAAQPDTASGPPWVPRTIREANEEPADSTASEAPAPARPAPRAQVEVRDAATPPAHTPTVLPDRPDPGQVQIPNLGTSGTRATQCTIMVSTGVRDRIAQYQLTKKMEAGKEPTNSVVVRRAFLHAKRGDLFPKLLSSVYHRQNPVDDEDYDDDGLLGEVVGRRAERGRMKDSTQQSFRPSYQELATYDAFSTAYGFPSRSDFLDACLDEFLPSLPASGRRSR